MFFSDRREATKDRQGDGTWHQVAAGAGLLVLPDAALGGYLADLRHPDPEALPPALKPDNPVLASVAALARACGRVRHGVDSSRHSSLEDGRVMDDAVDGCQRHGLVWKHLAPFAEWLIGGDQH